MKLMKPMHAIKGYENLATHASLARYENHEICIGLWDHPYITSSLFEVCMTPPPFSTVILSYSYITRTYINYTQTVVKLC